MTKKQHYVSQVYLRGFSLEYLPLDKSMVHKDKHTIYAYDLGIRKYDSNEPVPIKSICYKKLLYEIYDSDGKVILPNWLENYFKALEKLYGEYRDQLEEKTSKENFGCHNFLGRKERAFWATYIAIHLLRNYYALSAAEEALREMHGENVTELEIHSFICKYCLPFFGEIEEDSKYVQILGRFLNPMYRMQFAVGLDYQNRLITSDKGVSIISESFPTNEYSELIFPITSSICLFLFGNENKNIYGDNTLFELTENGEKHVMFNVIIDAYQKIYSNHRFTIEEKRFIKEQILERQKINHTTK